MKQSPPIRAFKKALQATILLSLCAGSGPSFAQAPKESVWTQHALKLFSDNSQVREEGLKALKRHPDLSKELSKAFGTGNESLALDVIAQLKLVSFFEVLLEKSKRDGSGFIPLALNSLVSPQQRPRLIESYRRSLRDSSVPTAAKITMLDSLTRLQASLEPELLFELLQNPDYDLRRSLLVYLRRSLLGKRLSLQEKEKRLSVVREAIKTRPYQLRVQSIYLISELPQALKSQAAPYLYLCVSDRNSEVRRLCRLYQKRLKEAAR